MTEALSLDFLLQEDRRNAFFTDATRNGWVTVSDSWHRDLENGAVHVALVPANRLSDSMREPGWTLLVGDGAPGCSQRYDEGVEVVEYHRFGESSGVEPFILVRDFHGLRTSVPEVIEEFRLFHNLWLNPTTGHLVKFTDAGEEDIIVRRNGRRIEVRVRELRQFLALKEMHAIVQIDSVRFSDLDLASVDDSKRSVDVRDPATRYRFHVSSARDVGNGRATLSRLIGKLAIPPVSKSDSGIWPFSEGAPQRYPEFVIGTNTDGAPIRYSCDPDKLANYFGANPHAPNYVTPVYFRREVLARYYNAPERFEVSDGGVSCASLWHLRIDNHLEDHVAAYLGDLGRDLPESERLHWLAHNVAADAGISKTKYLRDFRAEFADPEKEDLLFKHRFRQFCEAWEKTFGFPLFLPLAAGDRHLFTGLREPLTDSQGEFDSQVLALTKVLIDSLNEKELLKEIENVPADTKGISKLEMYLQSRALAATPAAISLLRLLQDLRSSGVGHRKGAKFEAASKAARLDELGARLAFRKLLHRAVTEFLEPLGDELLSPGWRQ